MADKFTISFEVPYRIECWADVEETLKSFQGQLSHYLRAHDKVGLFRDPNSGYEITPRAWVDKVTSYDKSRLAELVPDYSEEKNLPMVTALNALEKALGECAELKAELERLRA